MYYKCHFRCGGWYIDSPDWIKREKAKINPKNEDNKCFQYAATVGLNHEEIKRNQRKIPKVFYQCNWKGINYPSKKDDWKTRKIIPQLLLILYTIEKEICPAYISKINSNCEKQIIILMIPNEEK